MNDDLVRTSLVFTRAMAEKCREVGGGNQSKGAALLVQGGIDALNGAGTLDLDDVELAEVLAHRLRERRRQEQAAEVTATPSAAGWMPHPTGEAIGEFHRLMPGAVLAMPQGLMAWGEGRGAADAALSLDLGQGVLALTDPALPMDAEVGIEGVGDLAAVVDTLAEAHHQARRAAAHGKPIRSAAAECPALQLRARPSDEEGLAVIELAGASIRLHPLSFLQLLAEAAALLAREVARSVDQRQALEALVPQRPVVLGERSHGEG